MVEPSRVSAHPARARLGCFQIHADSKELNTLFGHKELGQFSGHPPLPVLSVVAAEGPWWDIRTFHRPLLPHEFQKILGAEELLPIIGHDPGIPGCLAVLEQAVVVGRAEDLTIDSPIPQVDNPFVVPLA